MHAGGEKEPLDERALAKVDPLSALLATGLLERTSYVLATLRAPGAAAPLLRLLARCCAAGEDVAAQAAATHGMGDALGAVLGTLPPGPESSNADVAYHAARPWALRALRALCQSSSAAAAWVLRSGAPGRGQRGAAAASASCR